jgi:hypothetical protein
VERHLPGEVNFDEQDQPRTTRSMFNFDLPTIENKERTDYNRRILMSSIINFKIPLQANGWRRNGDNIVSE